MKKIFCVIILSTSLSIIQAQLYFPPNGSNVWDTIAPTDLGWCQNQIDIGSESPGVYLLRIYDNKSHFLKTLKVIKK